MNIVLEGTFKLNVNYQINNMKMNKTEEHKVEPFAKFRARNENFNFWRRRKRYKVRYNKYCNTISHVFPLVNNGYQ